MKNKTALLLLIFLIITNSSFTQQSDGLAPKATAAEVEVEAAVDGSEAAFWDIPILEKAFIDAVPTDRKDGILVGELGIVSINGRDEKGISFSPDLDEIYFSANKKDKETAVYFLKLEGEKWAPIKKTNFTKGEKDAEMYPFVSFSGKKIYFTAYNPDLMGPKIWYVNRLENSWSKAIKLDSPINDDKVFYLNQAKNGDL